MYIKYNRFLIGEIEGRDKNGSIQCLLSSELEQDNFSSVFWVFYVFIFAPDSLDSRMFDEAKKIILTKIR